MAGSSSSGTAQRVLSQSFDASTTGRLLLSVPGADLSIVAHDTPRLEVDVSVDIDDEAKAKAYAESIKLKARSVDRQTYRIEARTVLPLTIDGLDPGVTLPLRVDIRIPRTYDVEIQASGGRLKIEDLDGRISLKASGGAIEARRLRGHLHVEGYGSRLAIDGFEGSELSILARGGSLKAVSLHADDISIEATGCPTTLEALDGATALSLTGASAVVQAVLGPLRSTFTASDATLHLAECHETYLHLSGGHLDLNLAPAFAARVLLEGPDLFVDDRLGFIGSQEDARIEGRLNDGRPLLHVVAAHGPIRCRRAS